MEYTHQDFKSKLEIKWCPGCGDYAVHAALLRAFPVIAKELNYTKERFAFVSGIGCSSRFPYYVHCFGFHGIHGRASAISTGVKVANPRLSVWQVTGDGDALAIGGNHFIHAIRRNIDINILLFNNEIYGLTKGQYSPTSKLGMITKTSPYGTVEHPFNPGELIIGARGTFFARSLDVEIPLSTNIMIEAARHDGTAVMEMLVNCVIFNDHAHGYIAEKEHREDRIIVLQHGQPMLFGKNRDKGLILDKDAMQLKVVELGKNGITENDILVHNAENQDMGIHMMLAGMKAPDMPVALGIIRKVKDKTYDSNVRKQLEDVTAKAKVHCVEDLLHSGATWEIE